MRSSPISIPRFDAAEIQRIVAKGKATGLIRVAGQPAPERPLVQAVAPLATPGQPAPSAGPTRTVWTDITPELAAGWLKNNFVNRPLREDVVQSYARDMANGTWVPTHQGVAFSDTNALIDGQHRLSAIVRTGLTIRMMVTYGLPALIPGREMTTMDAVDRGCPRSVADQLKIQHGLANGTIIAAVTASLGALCFGERTRRLSVGQTLEIYRTFQGGVDYVIEHRSKAHGFKAAGVLAAYAFAIAATDGSREAAAKAAGKEAAKAKPTPPRSLLPDLRSSYQVLLEGDALVPQSPLAALWAFLSSEDARLLTRGTDRGLAELVLHALKLEIEGAKIKLLTHSPEGLAYFRQLQPERVAKVAALFRLPEATHA